MDLVFQLVFFGMTLLATLSGQRQDVERLNGQSSPNSLNHSVSKTPLERPSAVALDRDRIVPLVAAHQHLLGPDSVRPPEFTKPVTADQLVQEMDGAGIQKGVVLSIAYWYGSPLHKPVEGEYAKVRAENDWTAQQVARYPQRLVFFCGVNPLKEYAISELERCAKIPQMKGIKLHFANSGVDLRNPEHFAKVQKFFRAANDHKLAIVVHIRSLREDYGRRDAEIFINDVLPVAPDIPIQIAHLAGSGPGYGPDAAMATYADAIMSGDNRTRNVYFDVTNCVTLKNDQSQEELDLIAKRLRQVGLKRIFFGSDMSTDRNPPMGPWWVVFRRRLPLTNDELNVIANNVPSYMR
jgi:uncharacterized protein